jgi:hypothetical protein
MWTINLALGYVAAILCMATGVIFSHSLFVGFSLVLALAIYVLDKILERRLIYQLYQQSLKPEIIHVKNTPITKQPIG